jgi:hypothetical protein
MALAAGSIVGASCQNGFLGLTLGSPSPHPNPHKLLVIARDLTVVARDLLVMARDLLVVARDLTAAG